MQRRHGMLLAASLLAGLPATARAHGGGGDGGGDGGGAGSGIDAAIRPATPTTFGGSLPPGFSLSNIALPGDAPNLSSDTHRLAAWTDAEWDAFINSQKDMLWSAAISVAEGANTLGDWSQWALNFVPGMDKVNVALTGSRGFAEGYAEALERGASQAEAIKEGTKRAAISAGLDVLGNRLTGAATDRMFNKAKGAVQHLTERSSNVPRAVTNSVGYFTTIAGLEAAKGAAAPGIHNTANRMADQLSRSVPNQFPVPEPGMSRQMLR